MSKTANLGLTLFEEGSAASASTLQDNFEVMELALDVELNDVTAGGKIDNDTINANFQIIDDNWPTDGGWYEETLSLNSSNCQLTNDGDFYYLQITLSNNISELKYISFDINLHLDQTSQGFLVDGGLMYTYPVPDYNGGFTRCCYSGMDSNGDSVEQLNIRGYTEVSGKTVSIEIPDIYPDECDGLSIFSSSQGTHSDSAKIIYK